MELSLSVGQSYRMSCLLNRPILFSLALCTISSAGSLVSTSAIRSSKSLYAARIVPSRYLMKGTTSSVPSCQPICACASAAYLGNLHELFEFLRALLQIQFLLPGFLVYGRNQAKNVRVPLLLPDCRVIEGSHSLTSILFPLNIRIK